MTNAGPSHRGAVVFDLDGTLVDSAPDIAASVNRALVLLGRATLPLEDVKRMVGDGARVLVERALRSGGPEPDVALVDRALDAFRTEYERDTVSASRLYPGVAETLRRLLADGWRMAVCTNKPLRPTRTVLASFGLDGCFGAVVGGDSTPYRKPHPEPLLAALAGLGASPVETIMVGDGMHDAGAAAAAGIRFIGVTWGYGIEGLRTASGLEPLVTRFDQIPQRLFGPAPAG